MSGIYIPMEMPTGCAECPFEMYYFNTGETRCRATNKTIETNYCPTSHEERDLDCPLVPVPEHGDLIDRDALIKSDRMVGKLMMFGGEYVYTQSEIDRAPTVIPADVPDMNVGKKEKDDEP